MYFAFHDDHADYHDHLYKCTYTQKIFYKKVYKQENNTSYTHPKTKILLVISPYFFMIAIILYNAMITWYIYFISLGISFLLLSMYNELIVLDYIKTQLKYDMINFIIFTITDTFFVFSSPVLIHNENGCFIELLNDDIFIKDDQNKKHHIKSIHVIEKMTEKEFKFSEKNLYIHGELKKHPRVGRVIFKKIDYIEDVMIVSKSCSLSNLL